MSTDSQPRPRLSLARIAVSSLLLAVLPVPPLGAGQVRSVGLAEMAHRADRIFSARCIAIDVVPLPQLGREVTEVTFEVERVVKGGVGRTVNVKLLGAGDGFDAPRFEPGERVVLFLHADGALGLTSPVGLGQGRFSIVEDKQGHELAVNAFGNRNLLGGLSGQTRARVEGALAGRDAVAGLTADTLLDVARDLLAAEKPAPRREER